jgi:hypothetical protein
MGFTDQFRELEELFQELLELRVRVRRAERAAAKRTDVDSNGSSPIRKKPQGRKRAKLHR